jgi:cholesterol oxidase
MKKQQKTGLKAGSNDRRRFIKSGLTATALAAGGALMSACKPQNSNLPTRHSNKKAVVIGSGFGGSVATLRLGQAGFDTVLLERGRHWSAGADGKGFPDTLGLASGDGRTTWLSWREPLSGMGFPVYPYAGLMERVEGNGIDAVCGAGLGGGSLVYAGVLMQPERALFEQTFPDIDYQKMDLDYYPRVLRRVSGGPIPEDLYQSAHYRGVRDFVRSAEKSDIAITRSEVGFDWNLIRAEIAGLLPPGATAGNFIFGCNSGAKNTLDKNYLREALDTGNVEIRVRHVVTAIEALDEGGFQVSSEVIDDKGRVQSYDLITADYVFMAAGSLNTSKLLLREKYRGKLPGLNSWVGKSWGTNGDEIAIRVSKNHERVTQAGPAFITALDQLNPIKPVGMVHAPISLFKGLTSQVLLGMNNNDRLGELVYHPDDDKCTINWSARANQSGADARNVTYGKIPPADQQASLALMDALPPSTWHPLGGMVMGQACSLQGEVYGQPGLFVVDGSLLPGNAAGAAPSLTIAANAERIMDYLTDNVLV